jgi:aminopeptidase N
MTPALGRPGPLDLMLLASAGAGAMAITGFAATGARDASDYDLDLDYDPETRLLDGIATISASATQSLCRFNLDLRGLSVSSVRVDHARAEWRREGCELVITPRRALPAGEGFTVDVRYSGEPGPAP